jgi:hypothetical protein
MSNPAEYTGDIASGSDGSAVLPPQAEADVNNAGTLESSQPKGVACQQCYDSHRPGCTSAQDHQYPCSSCRQRDLDCRPRQPKSDSQKKSAKACKFCSKGHRAHCTSAIGEYPCSVCRERNLYCPPPESEPALTKKTSSSSLRASPRNNTSGPPLGIFSAPPLQPQAVSVIQSIGSQPSA